MRVNAIQKDNIALHKIEPNKNGREVKPGSRQMSLDEFLAYAKEIKYGRFKNLILNGGTVHLNSETTAIVKIKIDPKSDYQQLVNIFSKLEGFVARMEIVDGLPVMLHLQVNDLLA